MGIGLMLTTMGGLCSDEHVHVLTPDYQVIPGLYACGNIQGDRFAVKYPFKLSGASHAMAVYYGKVAGENAAAEQQRHPASRHHPETERGAAGRRWSLALGVEDPATFVDVTLLLYVRFLFCVSARACCCRCVILAGPATLPAV